MSNLNVQNRSEYLLETIDPFMRYYTESAYMRLAGQPDVCDFAFGNPHDMPLPGFTAALGRQLEPKNKEWFAYKMSEPESQRIIASSLKDRLGIDFEPEDIAVTNGAFAGLAVTLHALVQPDDEVIFNIPPWFFYEGMIVSAGARAVRVNVDPDTFDLDLHAIEEAITPNTRAVLVNSPNNPTGKIYPPETLQALADLLEADSAKHGRRIFLISDEAYSQILFDERPFYSPTAFYPHSFLIYTFGKVLLTPGQRLGFIALPPNMPDRPTMRRAIFAYQIFSGWPMANALMQHALPDLVKLSIDMGQLQRRRDLLLDSLRTAGYDVHTPEGTFYLLPRSPIEDDWAFTELLAELRVLCLPGGIVEMPGTFRISLTANDEMVEKSIPRFREALVRARDL